MTLDVRRLRVLREVARQGTIAAAARALHLTPPAVSQQLAALEREADVRLLEREGRKVALTEAAHTLVAHTETILAQLEAAAADIAAMEGRYGGSLRIGAFPTAAASFVAVALAELAPRLPMVRVHVEELEPERALDLLKSGNLDLAVAHEYDLVPRRADPALHRVELHTEPLRVALPPGHPLADAAGVDLAALADERWIAPPDGLTCLEELHRLCGSAGFEPVLGSHAYTHPLVFALVAAGLGVALVPELAVRQNLAGAAVRPLQHPAGCRRVFAATRRGTAHRPSIAATLDALRAAADAEAR
ncbi:LysR substrate-binding domain-containing protein [Spirillospora sp. CA-142024]|uniref:LysR family transcriptional regulator n=1 Tax=Spirillospora sp. CA-142024 TaxID=3240036 RepID=UPI003D935E63